MTANACVTDNVLELNLNYILHLLLANRQLPESMWVYEHWIFAHAVFEHKTAGDIDVKLEEIQLSLTFRL